MLSWLLLLAGVGLAVATGVRAYRGREVRGFGRGPMDPAGVAMAFGALALLALSLFED